MMMKTHLPAPGQLLACLLLALSALVQTAARAQAAPRKGDGTTAARCEIATKEDLKEFRDRVNAGDKSLCAVLTQDIDLKGERWTPATDYSGTFDGQGHTLKNLCIDSEEYFGLFGQTTGATIRQLVLENPMIALVPGVRVPSALGFVVGYAAAGTVIEGVRISGGELADQRYDIYHGSSACSHAGSVAGMLDASEIRSCTNGADILAPYYCGGIAGGIRNGSKIADCANHGKVTCQNTFYSAYSYAGGIVGELGRQSTVSNVLCTGSIVNESFGLAGLFAGKSVGSSAEPCKAGGGIWAYASSIKTTAITGSGTLTTLDGQDITTLVRRFTPEALASGEAAWLLNGSTATPPGGGQPAWQQRLGTDAMPEPVEKEGGTVYHGTVCDTGADLYTNDAAEISADGKKHRLQLVQCDGIALYEWVCTACDRHSEEKYIRDFCAQEGYDLPLRYNVDGSFTALEPVSLADGTAYNSPVAFTADTLTYTRTFTSAAWQTLYLPFALPTASLPEGVEVAVLSNFHEYEEAGRSCVELEVKLVRDGSTVQALTPCVIRSREAAPLELQLTAVELEAAEARSIDCWSMARYYRFTGTMEGKTAFDSTTDFVMRGGELWRAAATAQLRPQRWYLTATDRTSPSDTPATAAPQRISVRESGEGGATAVEGVRTAVIGEGSSALRRGIYDLQGRRLGSEPARGVYVKDGRKCVK